jgi:hypothetical protein
MHRGDEKFIKPEMKRLLGIPRHKWDNNIKINSVGMDSLASEYEPMAGSCEHGNAPLYSIKGAGFLGLLSDYYFLKQNFVPRSY